jgi:hypothetical protein
MAAVSGSNYLGPGYPSPSAPVEKKSIFATYSLTDRLAALLPNGCNGSKTVRVLAACVRGLAGLIIPNLGLLGMVGNVLGATWYGAKALLCSVICGKYSPTTVQAVNDAKKCLNGAKIDAIAFLGNIVLLGVGYAFLLVTAPERFNNVFDTQHNFVHRLKGPVIDPKYAENINRLSPTSDLSSSDVDVDSDTDSDIDSDIDHVSEDELDGFERIDTPPQEYSRDRAILDRLPDF